MRSPSLFALFVVVSLPAAAAPAWKRLGVETATSSSYLQSNWNKYDENYHPNYVLDDNPKTAWVEGAEGNGEGESITLPFSELKSARSLKVVVFNGYQKTPKLLTANAAPKEVLLIVRDDAGVNVVAQRATLEAKNGPQEVVIDIPPKHAIASVSLSITSVTPGSAYKDTCISDIAVYVDSDVAYNEAVEQKKLAAAKAWIKERVKTAKAFASRPKTYPFASTHFNADKGGGWSDEDTAVYDDNGGFKPIAGRTPLGRQISLGKGSGIIGKVFTDDELTEFTVLATGGSYRMDRPGDAPVPDGLAELSQYVPDDVLAALASPGAVFFEGTKDQVNVDGVLRSRFAVEFDEKDKKIARRVSFHERHETHEREDYVSERDYEFTFDDKGVLATVAAKAVEDSGGITISLLSFERDAQGRISGVKVRSASGGKDTDGGVANTTWTAHFSAVQPGA